jgi:Arc/MetJ-type ribon-helix-helix transcriptional regulator
MPHLACANGQRRGILRGVDVTFVLPPAQAEKLREMAERLGVSPSDLARAATTDLLAARDDEFRKAAERVLRENRELYERLA